MINPILGNRKLKQKIISQLKLEIPTYDKKNIPDNYKKAFTHLSKYETPKEVLVIDNFPENNGKINRLKIRSIINNS